MAQQPNILLIITDHHAHVHHQHTGAFNLNLPAHNKFLTEAVSFERAYSVCPLSSPARSSMMSGVYPSTHGLRWNTDNPKGLSDFREDQRLYNHYLEEAGYRNHYVGKWHCGHTKGPADYGLPGWSLLDYGRVYDSERYQAYAEERGLGEARAFIEHWLGHPEEINQTHVLKHDSPWYFMNAAGVQEGPPDAHHDFFVANLACDELQKVANKNEPWSLVASFWGPHQPYYPTEPFAGSIDPKSIPEYPTFNDDLAGRPSRHKLHRDVVHGAPRGQWPDWATWQKVLARAYEQQMLLDAAIGRLLDTLEATGQTDNTMVIWVADHGDALASHGGVWDKSSTYTEEVGRVPLAIRWPGQAKAGTQTSKLVSNMDVTATMLDAAGLTVPEHMHSRSLRPVVQNPEEAVWPDEVISEHHGHGFDLLQRIVVTDRYKYVAALLDGDELYDLQEDPYETNNLIQDPGCVETLRDMRHRLVCHLEKVKDQPARPLKVLLEAELRSLAATT